MPPVPYQTLINISIQSTILNGISNILAQVIDQYKRDKPFSLNITALLQFITYGVIIVPINHYWQRWLEITFPGFLFQSNNDPATSPAGAGAGAGPSGSGVETPSLPFSRSRAGTLSHSRGIGIGGSVDLVEVKEKLVPSSTRKAFANSPRLRRLLNFLAKFTLDATLGGIFNIILFVMLINLLKGASLSRSWELVLEDFKPIMIARLKFRPVVSTLMYTIVPLDRRVVFGSGMGVIWGVYLSLYAAV
ncbi:uncharacterized protein BDV14DRAFT_201402 [Aspergillus stella-maris]|uniref:uncharacterized protein n=1 Tax=Aspergillus stella-maris TaxID=1810926 RepID=UPI003CCDD59B